MGEDSKQLEQILLVGKYRTEWYRLDVCGWATGGKALSCDMRQKIHEQQSVKHTKTIADQTTKTNRGVKRDCTEGNSCDYQLYLSDKKQKHKGGDSQMRE